MISMIQDGLQFVKKNDLPTIWAAFVSHDAHPFLQFVKYGVCGVMAVITHNAIFYALAYTQFPAIEGMMVGGEPLSDGLRARNVVICNSVGFVFANLVAYLTNVLWVFQSGRHHRSQPSLFRRVSQRQGLYQRAIAQSRH